MMSKRAVSPLLVTLFVLNGCRALAEEDPRELLTGKKKSGKPPFGPREDKNLCQFFYDVAANRPDYLFQVTNWLPDTKDVSPVEQASQNCTPADFGQPSCDVTCDTNSDNYFFQLSGLTDGKEPNSISLGEVLDNEGKQGRQRLQKIIKSFGDFKPMNEKQRECVLNYYKGGPDPSLYNASYVLYYAVGQFAPYIRGDTCDQELGSMGLFYDTDIAPEVQSICNPDSPGYLWNKYLVNETIGYTALFEACGYTFVDNYFSDMVQGIGCYGLVTAGLCQQCRSTGGANPKACYCVLEPAKGLHCPMFGPIYYMNQRVVYQVGGVDYLLSMPGKRVKCKTANKNADCFGMCRPRCLCEFPACSHKYKCKTVTQGDGTTKCECSNGYSSVCSA